MSIDVPIRQQSAKGLPKPTTGVERTCQACKASFIGLAAGKTGERGIWWGWNWWCSVECAPPEARKEATAEDTEGDER